jgi:competence ComEA-like helix-hairpin-helix protein
MTAFFAYRWYSQAGLVDIDNASAIRAEFKVDINSAGLGEIVVLPGVGQKLARAIIDHRQESGEFVTLNELCDVPGIGEKKLQSLLPFLLPIKQVVPNRPSSAANWP